MPLLRIFNVANMSFKAICENKILAKFSEFTVLDAYHIHGYSYRQIKGIKCCFPFHNGFVFFYGIFGKIYTAWWRSHSHI